MNATFGLTDHSDSRGAEGSLEPDRHPRDLMFGNHRHFRALLTLAGQGLAGRVETMCSTMCLASRPTPPNSAELSE